LTPSTLGAAISQASHHELLFVLYSVAKSIDAAAREQHPLHTGGIPGPLLDRYDRTGRYNESDDGYVLPKWTTRPFRGTFLTKHFDSLVRAKVNTNQVRLIRQTPQSRGLLRPDSPRVVVAPFLYKFPRDGRFESENQDGILADSGFEARTINAQPHFLVTYETALLRERILETVAAIRASDATIAIFPELVLNAELMADLQSALYETRKRGSALQWVIAGSAQPSPEVGSVWPVANEAWVLDSLGNVLVDPSSDAWKQRKTHRYKLDKTAQARSGLEHFFPAPLVDREEAIAIGNRLLFFEDRSGRYAVLICEDSARFARYLDAIRRLLPRVLFVVLMDSPLVEDRWPFEVADSFVTETGGHVVIANSLLLPNSATQRDYRRQHHKDYRDPYPLEKQNVGVFISPPIRGTAGNRRTFLQASSAPDRFDNTSLISNCVEIPDW